MEDWELKKIYEGERVDLKQLLRVRFEDRKDLPTVSAIYFVLTEVDNGCLYIGQATNLFNRWRGQSHHLANILTMLPSIWIAWIEAPTPVLLDLEEALISRFNPPLNFQLRKNPYYESREKFKVMAEMTNFLRQNRSLDRRVQKATCVEVELLLKEVLSEGKSGSELEKIEVAFTETEPDPHGDSEEQKPGSHLHRFIRQTGLTQVPSKQQGLYVGEIFTSLKRWYKDSGILEIDGDGKNIWSEQADPRDKNVMGSNQLYKELIKILPGVRKIKKNGKLWIPGLIFDSSKIVPEPQSDEAG